MLTKTQTNDLKSKLQQRFVELQKEISQALLASDNEQHNKIAGLVHDQGDDSLADLLVDINLAVIDQHIQEIKEVEAALLRIGTDKFGICLDCESPIKFKRLEVQPIAKRCINCQEIYESTHAQPGHHKL